MKSFRECLRALRALSRPVRWRLAVTILVGMARVAVSLLFVIVSKFLIDIATGADPAPIGPAIGLFTAILLAQVLLATGGNWWDNYTRVKTQNILRINLFSHVIKSRWDGRERFLSGDTVNRLEEDIRVVADLVCTVIPGMVVTLVQLVASSAYLLTLASELLWILIILMGTAVAGSKMFFRRLRELMAKIRARESELQQHMQESLQHRVLVLTLTSVERVLEKFGRMQADVEANTRKRLNYNAVARGLMFLGFQAGHAAAFIWGVLGIRAGRITYGTMTAFLQLVSRVQRPIADAGHHIPAFIQALTSVERLMELQELEPEAEADPITLKGAPQIEISHVTYAYPGTGIPVLKDFSCRFAAGSFSAVAGPTGIGKSTLIRMILGLLRPAEGTVLIDGIPASAALRGNFMYIPQGNTLLSGTIRSNLLAARPEADETEMKEVLETAMADFVFSLPKGLDTPCGESGSGLSEGQAQRIAIARALLRPGGVLILDESTSALDAATEDRLLDHLYSRYHGRKTIIFISHRERVVQRADAVIEL